MPLDLEQVKGVILVLWASCLVAVHEGLLLECLRAGGLDGADPARSRGLDWIQALEGPGGWGQDGGVLHCDGKRQQYLSQLELTTGQLSKAQMENSAWAEGDTSAAERSICASSPRRAVGYLLADEVTQK